MVFVVFTLITYMQLNYHFYSTSYVNGKGWQHYFKSYCIPEDLVPRILSPAYFHHYNVQPMSVPAEVQRNNLPGSKCEQDVENSRVAKTKENEGEQLVMGLGPVQRSFWRLSKLVPLAGLRQINKYRGHKVGPVEASSMNKSAVTSSIEDVADEPQSLEIQEGSDGVSLKPIPDSISGSSDKEATGKLAEKRSTNIVNGRKWQRVPYLPSYVPFGQVCTSITIFKIFMYFISSVTYVEDKLPEGN